MKARYKGVSVVNAVSLANSCRHIDSECDEDFIINFEITRTIGDESEFYYS